MTLIQEVRTLQNQVEQQINRFDVIAATHLDKIDSNRADIDILREQINGQRGLSVALDDLVKKVESLTRAAYWVAGVIFVGTIGFAFTVLAASGKLPG